MDDNALGFASYWRNSLADAESGKGSFERKDAKNFTHWHGIAAGRLDETSATGLDTPGISFRWQRLSAMP